MFNYDIDEVDVDVLDHLGSSICQEYRQCGRKFFLKQIMGLEDHTWPATEYGTSIHNALNRFSRLYKKYNVDYSILSRLFLKEWEKNSKKIVNWRIDSYDHLMEQGLLCIKDLEEYIIPLLLSKNYDTEVFYKGSIPNVKRIVQGTIDLQLYDKPVIIDYKFGRGMHGYADSKGYRLNMATYAHFYKKRTGIFPKAYIIKQKWKKSKGKWHHNGIILDNLQEANGVKFSEDYLEYYYNIYQQIEKGIENKIFLPAQDTDFLCNVCVFKNKECDIPGYK